MESLLQVVNESTATAKRPHRTLDVKLVPLSVKDDIEAYLVTFEEFEVARDPTSRMPFISAGLEIRTIGCSYVY